MSTPTTSGLSALERIRAAQGATHAPTDASVAPTQQITVAASSNAPTRFNDVYNAQTHRWSSLYVQPTEYRLSLTLTQATATLTDPVKWHLESKDRRFGPIDVADNGIRVGMMGATPKGTVIVRIPFAGPIEVTASWKQVVRKTVVDLRDFLIVSIGDSFSSGQGNPDRYGTETVGSGAVCEVPTLIKLAQAIANAKEDGLDWLGENVPGIGAMINMADDIGEGITEFAGDIVSGVGDYLGFGGGPEQFIHMSAPPLWLEPLAWRSLKSAPSLATQSAELRGWARLTTFVSVASSGAEIEKGLLKPQYPFQRVGQIEEVRRLLSNPRDLTSLIRPVDVLVMSIGGNDCGFSGTLSDLGTEHFVLGMLWHGATQAEARKKITAQISDLASEYDELDETIRKSLAPKAIVIPEYPAPIFDGTDGKPHAGCGIFDLTEEVGDVIQYRMGISRSDAAFVEEMGNDLNVAIAEAADRNGWTIAGGIAKDFKTHGYCSSHPYWVSASDSCHQQDDMEGTCHPNAAGTKVVANHLVTEIHAILNNHTKNDPKAGVRSMPPPPGPRQGTVG